MVHRLEPERFPTLSITVVEGKIAIPDVIYSYVIINISGCIYSVTIYSDRMLLSVVRQRPRTKRKQTPVRSNGNQTQTSETAIVIMTLLYLWLRLFNDNCHEKFG